MWRPICAHVAADVIESRMRKNAVGVATRPNASLTMRTDTPVTQLSVHWTLSKTKKPDSSEIVVTNCEHHVEHDQLRRAVGVESAQEHDCASRNRSHEPTFEGLE